MTWGVIYFLLWVYRCIFSVLAELVIARLTSLGDSAQYADTLVERDVGDSLANAFDSPRHAATALTEGLGSLFANISGGIPFFTNICFQTIAFVGILAVLRATPSRFRLLLLACVMLPSFSIWSSVASKEALLVYAVGMLSALAIRMYSGSYRLTIWHALSLIMVALAKEEYVPALAFLLAGTFVARHVRQHTSLVLWAGLLSLVFLFLFADRLTTMVMTIPLHFENLGNSRPSFWTEPNDVFAKAPLGMFLAFFGPTFAEATSAPLQMITFVESSLLLATLVIVLLTRLPRMPVYMTLMGGFTLFWIMFAAYPIGAMNAGSAIRYRTSYQLLIFALIIVVMSRSRYKTWIESRAEKHSGARPQTIPRDEASPPLASSHVHGGPSPS